MTTEHERLRQLIEDDRTITFFKSHDREHPGIQWTVYGLPQTHEIVVCATAGGKEFFKSATSRLTYPAMDDRIFGIDVVDNELAEELSLQLWESHGTELKRLADISGSR
jgi:hypothetical protein